MNPRLIDENEVAACVSAADALREMRELFEQVARGTAVSYPVVRESVGDAIFGVKSGACTESGVLGLKAGGYFPQNALHGSTRHQSVIVLFDPQRGMPLALMAGNLITKLRTAAAAALSIDLLARRDASTLAVIGAGAQVPAHVEAACAVRHFKQVKVWNRTPAHAQRVVQSMNGLHPGIQTSPSAHEAVVDADVIITLTPSREPLLQRAWIQPGAHLACMGADTVGKQEVDPAIIADARVFTDSIDQAATIGECQAGLRGAFFGREHILGTLGDVLVRRADGRKANDEITVFDGTGLAVQDLQMAALILNKLHRQHLP
jgi:alanine dehydrogenase